MALGKIALAINSMIFTPTGDIPSNLLQNDDLYNILMEEKKGENDEDTLSPFSQKGLGKSINTYNNRPGNKEILDAISSLKSKEDFPLNITYPKGYPKDLPTKIHMSWDHEHVYILLENDSILKSFVITPDVGKIKEVLISNGNITLKSTFGLSKTWTSEKMTELLFKLMDGETDSLFGVSIMQLKPKILKKAN